MINKKKSYDKCWKFPCLDYYYTQDVTYSSVYTVCQTHYETYFGKYLRLHLFGPNKGNSPYIDINESYSLGEGYTYDVDIGALTDSAHITNVDRVSGIDNFHLKVTYQDLTVNCDGNATPIGNIIYDIYITKDECHNKVESIFGDFSFKADACQLTPLIYKQSRKLNYFNDLSVYKQ